MRNLWAALPKVCGALQPAGRNHPMEMQTLYQREQGVLPEHFLTEEQIEDAILAAVNYFIENPDLLDQGVTVLKTELESAQSRKLTGQIQECLENGQYSADAIRQLVFERARAQYQEAAIDDSGFRTEKLKAALTGRVPQVQFDPELFRQTIQK